MPVPPCTHGAPGLFSPEKPQGNYIAYGYTEYAACVADFSRRHDVPSIVFDRSSSLLAFFVFVQHIHLHSLKHGGSSWVSKASSNGIGGAGGWSPNGLSAAAAVVRDPAKRGAPDAAIVNQASFDQF
jgi:hypothetical protein